MLGSLGLHLTVIGAYALASTQRRPTIDLTERAIMTKMVRLGKKKDPKLLPRKIEAPAASPDEKLLAVDKEVEPEPEQDLDKKKKDALKKIEEEAKRQKAREEALRRIADKVGDEEPEGDPEGSVYGEADGKVSLIQAYYGQLHDRIKAFYTVPAIISEAERRRLVAVVVIYVAQDGAILKHELEQESGNDAFDAALEAALQRASPLPAPPVFLRDQLREGVALRFRP
jgi:TonB family protein